MLRDAGYVVVIATGKQEVTMHITANPPDAVLANLQRDAFSTLETFLYITHAFSNVPLLIVTEPVVSEAARRTEPPTGDTMGKPNTLDDLLDRVGSVLASS